MTGFLTGNEWYWRLARTVVEGVLGVLVANLDTILGFTALGAGARTLVVALVAAVASPVLAALGADGDADENDTASGDADADGDPYYGDEATDTEVADDEEDE